MITGAMRIYFMKPVGMDGPIKIGCSRNLDGRLQHLARWSPFPLEFIGSVKGDIVFERAIHRRFAADLVHSEWFRPSPELSEFMAKALSVQRIDHAFAIVGGVARDLPRFCEAAE